MKPLLCMLFFGSLVLSIAAQKGDTLHVQPEDLNIKDLQMGEYTYLIVRLKAKDSPATSMILAKISVERQTYHNKAAIVVRQQWERDSIVHKAYTVFDARDFSTLLHDTYWRAQGFDMIFDFETRKFGSRNIIHDIPDSIKTSCEEEFAASFAKYNLNWHDDLIIYSMLPYKENRTFLINYYDPGFGKPIEVPYTVTSSGILTDRGGARIDCWVLEHDDENGTEKFWISKKTREVLKEEDHGKGGTYRFKYKLGISA
jgi:hypothetical protein